jgi:hypothetical protein
MPKKIKPKRPERWKEIKDYPMYQVSSHGRIRKVAHYKKNLPHKIRRKTFKRYRLIPSAKKVVNGFLRNGYKTVSLWRKEFPFSKSVRKDFYVHHLVAYAFKDVRGKRAIECKYVSFKDNDRTNLYHMNLEYCESKVYFNYKSCKQNGKRKQLDREAKRGMTFSQWQIHQKNEAQKRRDIRAAKKS